MGEVCLVLTSVGTDRRSKVPLTLDFDVAKIMEVSDKLFEEHHNRHKQKHVHSVKVQLIFSEFAAVQKIVHNSAFGSSPGYLRYAVCVKSFSRAFETKEKGGEWIDHSATDDFDKLYLEPIESVRYFN